MLWAATRFVINFIQNQETRKSTKTDFIICSKYSMKNYDGIAFISKNSKLRGLKNHNIQYLMQTKAIQFLHSDCLMAKSLLIFRGGYVCSYC